MTFDHAAPFAAVSRAAALAAMLIAADPFESTLRRALALAWIGAHAELCFDAIEYAAGINPRAAVMLRRIADGH